MPTPLSGPGLGLPLPQNLYPSELFGAPYDTPTNRVSLAPGFNIPVPAGTWLIGLGGYLVLQYFDPVTNSWTFGSGSAFNRGPIYVKSDGFNVRIANLTGCVCAATISSAGSSYVQATTTVTVTGSTATFAPIVGGQLTASVANAGAGYGIAPLVLIPAPPGPSNNANGVGGFQASAWANIASGTVNTVTFTNPGAGYQSAPANAALLPVLTDPNISSGITLGTVSFSLSGSGSITGLICTNNGAAITPANVTVSVNGAGTTATVAAVVMQTITAATVSAPGVGYGTAPGAVITTGGVPSSSGVPTNGPDALLLSWFPRPANIGLTPTNTSVSAGTAGVIYDGGLFLGSPTASWVTGGTVGTISTIGAIALVMGSKADIAIIQPAP